MSYHHNVKKFGKEAAGKWLTNRLKHLENKVYGKGFESRARGLMRYVEDKEMGEM